MTCPLHRQPRPDLCNDCARGPREGPLRSIPLSTTLTGQLQRTIDERGRIVFRPVRGPLPTPESRKLPWAQAWD